MIVGVLEIQLRLHDTFSLKDKRRVIRSLKDRIANKFNVSISEIDALDNCRLAVLGVSQVGNDGQYVQSCLDKIVDKIRMVREASLIEYHIEML